MILPFGKDLKIPKISALFEGVIFGRAQIGKGKYAFQNRLRIYWEGNVCLKIHWASLQLEGNLCQ